MVRPQFLKNIRSLATGSVVLATLFISQASAQGQTAETAASLVAKGEYLAQAEPDGVNPGTDYIRVALVHNADVTREALTRIVATLG